MVAMAGWLEREAGNRWAISEVFRGAPLGREDDRLHSPLEAIASTGERNFATRGGIGSVQDI